VRQSQVAVLERNTTFEKDFETEPFEVAWAAEARWYAQILEHEGAPVSFVTQISPDGLHWIDLPDSAAEAVDVGLVSWSARDFGHWLRVRAGFGNGGGRVKVRIYLALKE